jgi:hypothetical protein
MRETENVFGQYEQFSHYYDVVQHFVQSLSKACVLGGADYDALPFAQFHPTFANFAPISP